MALQHVISTTNALGSLGASAFTWTPSSTTNRTYLNDGRMDKQFAIASGSSTPSVVIDLGSAANLTAFAVLNSNVYSAGASNTITIKGADNSGISSNVATVMSGRAVRNKDTDDGAYGPRHRDHVFQFARTSRRYWQLSWGLASSITLKVGELWAFDSESTTLDVLFDRASVYPSMHSEKFLTTDFRSYTGERRSTVVGGPLRRRTVDFQDLTEAQRDELLDIWRRTNGGGSAALWVEQYSSADTSDVDYQDCILGKFSQSELEWSEVDFQLYTPNRIEFESLGRHIGG